MSFSSDGCNIIVAVTANTRTTLHVWKAADRGQRAAGTQTLVPLNQNARSGGTAMNAPIFNEFLAFKVLEQFVVTVCRNTTESHKASNRVSYLVQAWRIIDEDYNFAFEQSISVELPLFKSAIKSSSLINRALEISLQCERVKYGETPRYMILSSRFGSL
jgi:hypothetical protein